VVAFRLATVGCGLAGCETDYVGLYAAIVVEAQRAPEGGGFVVRVGGDAEKTHRNILSYGLRGYRLRVQVAGKQRCSGRRKARGNY